MARNISNEEFLGNVSFLMEFSEKIQEISEDLQQVIQHLQTIEEELGGEGAEFDSFIKRELVPVVKEYKETGNMKHEEIAQLVQDEESLERTIEKVNNGITTEISEIKSFGSELRSLENMSEDAEEALEKIERFEKSVD
jgi:uncharacterized coiled-coil DUF342 family protein